MSEPDARAEAMNDTEYEYEYEEFDLGETTVAMISEPANPHAWLQSTETQPVKR